MPFPEHAYGNPALRGARDMEYDAFSRVTRMLRQSPRECTGGETIAAVAKNNDLWTLLATDLSDPRNALADETKAGLLSLALFSLRHGQRVLAGDATTDTLIEINISVMKGLRGGAG
ncbi:flagellar protein FlaF [Paracoccus laeviglucosivorans]|uniref:Flagellar protein FlaF n=2 Tax=Paracoccus laeviglucosivorans TaxID=1197861 RepID=A0A521F754_9RHOB|nr:flagellar protein FlaF [Paracoccus laeviglucosivorans]